MSRARITAIRRAGASLDARPKMRLADEYDAAQERGEVATLQNTPGSGGHVAGFNMPSTAADLGLRRDEIHDARKLRDAALNDIVKRDNDGDPAVRS